MKKVLCIACVALCASLAGYCESENKQGPDLSGSWPTTMTLGVLQGDGLIPPGKIDSAAAWTQRLASERLSKNMWQQVYLIRFNLRSGDSVSAIAVIDYSPTPDMNMGPVVYVISKVLQPEGKTEPPKK